MTTVGPTLSEPPKFNHVAMSVPADLLDADGRAAILEFYGDVFGFIEHPQMTEDRKVLVMGAHTVEQFVFLVAQDDFMRAHHHDHYGMSVATKDDFDEIHRRAAAWKDKLGDEVTLDGPGMEEHHGVLQLHNFYVAYRLPLTIEVQYFDWLIDLDELSALAPENQ
ncbi:MAG: hypothetical protein QOG87_1183 [Actinomycetota bacterium]|jgi:hypothetical protein